MWQGRAQGLQQQLDQAMQEQLRLRRGMAAVEAAVGDRQHQIRCTSLALPAQVHSECSTVGDHRAAVQFQAAMYYTCNLE